MQVVGLTWMRRSELRATVSGARLESTIVRRLSTDHSRRDRRLSTGCAHLVQSTIRHTFVQAPERGWTDQSA